ncbi:PDZ domain-containing protein GIPC1-like [Clavelina lepadiformis]|uniref:PDZ domain-containing protein n=1 Tax=Clavelina lepadiformis TaxID=159417 RepID=A0ABP0F7Z8_CLALP
MPFANPFKRKKEKQASVKESSNQNLPPEKAAVQGNGNTQQQPEPVRPLVFHAQLAHGSPTSKIEGFANIRELYAKIAEAFQISADQIIFCTLNTHKCDMDRLIGGQIGLEDFIFAHVKGERKVVSITKTENSLGLTITDNGNGYPFIKRLKENSIVEKHEMISVGDLIEAIDDKSTVGVRHFQVARHLKDIPVGTTFNVTLMEPKKAFNMISQRSTAKAPVSNNNVGSGKATLRLRSKGPATLEALPTDVENKAVAKIDDLLDSFLGIRDMELSSTIWESGKGKANPDEFITTLNDQLGDFGFPQEFIFDVWGVILDSRAANSF